MNFSSNNGRKKAAIGFGAVALLAGTLVTAAVANAQEGVFASCSGDAQVRFGTASEFPGGNGYDSDLDYGNHLLQSGVTTQVVAFALPAGTYDLSAVSIDGYELRSETEDQPHEEWFAEFLSADGTVLATSGPTGDLDTGVEVATWDGSIGQVSLAEDAVTLRAVHVDTDAVGSPNSVRAVCVGATASAPEEEPVIETEVEGITEEREVVDPGPAPEQVPAPEVDPDLESSISVNYDSDTIDPEMITLLCTDVNGVNLFADGIGTGPNADSAVDLVHDPVAAGSVCTVTFPSMADHDCTMSVTPIGLDELTIVESDGSKTITFPADFEVDVFVNVYCSSSQTVDTEVLGEVEVAPDPVETPAEAPAEAPVETEVLGEVTTAPVAQVQDANPTFTG